MVKFFRIFEIKSCCFVFAMNDLLHDVEAIDDLCNLLIYMPKIFGNQPGFTGITHIQKKIAR